MNADEVADSIVVAILNDLGGRSGVGNALDEIDSDIHEEMYQSLKDLVLEKLKNYTGL